MAGNLHPQCCGYCGYPKYGLTSPICPECGRHFESTASLPARTRDRVKRVAVGALMLILAGALHYSGCRWFSEIHDPSAAWTDGRKQCFLAIAIIGSAAVVITSAALIVRLWRPQSYFDQDRAIVLAKALISLVTMGAQLMLLKATLSLEGVNWVR
jgi:uncharacterized membrane protein YcjF (UPF0283 family)